MQRDIRLHGLSSDHHHALRLASTIQRANRHGTIDPALVATVRETYQRELLPHFAIEEEVLLPALAAVGQAELVSRTLTEHAELARQLEAAAAGDPNALARFGEQLEAHVRFEERELFVACEASLPARVLEAVAQRAPKREGAVHALA